MFRALSGLWILIAVAVGCGGRSPDDDADAAFGRDASTMDGTADRGAPPPADGAAPVDRDAPPGQADISLDARDALATLDGSAGHDVVADVSLDAPETLDARDAAHDPFDGSDDPADVTDATGAGNDATDAPPVLDVFDAARDMGPPSVDADAPSPIDADAPAAADADVATPTSDVLVDGAVDAMADVEDACAICGLIQLAVYPTDTMVAVRSTRPMRAIGFYLDNSTRDLTEHEYLLWASSMPAVVLVSNTAGTRGLITAVGPGVSSVSAQVGGISGSAQVTVTGDGPVALSISPLMPSVAPGTKLPLTCTATYLDGTTQDVTSLAAWSSSAPSFASIDTSGVVTGIMSGSTTITASLGSLSTSVSLTVQSGPFVSVTISPSSVTLPAGVVNWCPVGDSRDRRY